MIPPDRHDIALLRLCSPSAFEFTKTAAQERRASELFREGFLERKWETYSVTAGGASIQQRWSYRLSEKGVAAIAADSLTNTPGRQSQTG